VGDTVNISGQSNSLSEDLANLPESSNCSDVTLAIGPRKFKVHKSILSVRSLVFNAMFEHEMENKQNLEFRQDGG